MDSEIQIMRPIISKRIFFPQKQESKTNYIIIIICSIIIFFCIINFIGELFIIIENRKKDNLEKKLLQNISNLEVKLNEVMQNKFNDKNYNKLSNNSKEFSQIINDKYIEGQKLFCSNFDKFNNSEYEKQIRTAKVDFNNKSFDMYVFKNSDIVSNYIFYSKRWEEDSTNKILEVLNYYSIKKNIKNEDIYILDIGANVGWYSY
jgi:hypothetical protein